MGAGLALPTIVPASVFGAQAPSERITVGCIGVGRMGNGDLTDALGLPQVQVVAVCDLDSKRAALAKKRVESSYAKRSPGGDYKGCAVFGDFRELVARSDIDAVQISTPDHWHALPALEAARNGKDIFMQKPCSLTIQEGRVVSDTVRRLQPHLPDRQSAAVRRRTSGRPASWCATAGSASSSGFIIGFGTDPGCGPQADDARAGKPEL